jgi:hypothetical protein
MLNDLGAVIVVTFSATKYLVGSFTVTLFSLASAFKFFPAFSAIMLN